MATMMKLAIANHLLLLLSISPPHPFRSWEPEALVFYREPFTGRKLLLRRAANRIVTQANARLQVVVFWMPPPAKNTLARFGSFSPTGISACFYCFAEASPRG